MTSFVWSESEVEVFAQPVPVYAQHGFRHMVIEGRLLALGGFPLRDRVRALRRAGMKTEPAFARALGLDEANPHQSVLDLERATAGELEALLAATSSP